MSHVDIENCIKEADGLSIFVCGRRGEREGKTRVHVFFECTLCICYSALSFISSSLCLSFYLFISRGSYMFD